tara:strand:+ start:3971 stop:4174 length:204 start_codon:yes stop_codon:yes gene_type:complete
MIKIRRLRNKGSIRKPIFTESLEKITEQTCKQIEVQVRGEVFYPIYVCILEQINNPIFEQLTKEHNR